MVFHWSLRGNKSPQVFGTLLSILADLNNAVVSMVFTRPLISKSSSPCTYSLVIIPNASVVIGITDTFMFHCYSCSHGRSRYLPLFSLSFSFTIGICRNSKVHYSAGSLFYFVDHHKQHFLTPGLWHTSARTHLVRELGQVCIGSGGRRSRPSDMYSGKPHSCQKRYDRRSSNLSEPLSNLEGTRFIAWRQRRFFRGMARDILGNAEHVCRRFSARTHLTKEFYGQIYHHYYHYDY